MLQLSIMGVHHNAENFPDPETFVPERWLDSTKSNYYFPFGDGPKIW
jgi:cytochrome P450 family 6